MKVITHIIESSATGTLSVVLMATHQQVKNHTVNTIYSRRPDTPQNITSLFESQVNLIEEDLSAKRFPWSVFALRRHLKQLKPDIIHCHSSFAGFVGRLASLGLKGKVFYSPHCISFMRQDISETKRHLFKLFERIGCMKSSTYIACSLSEKKAIEQALPTVTVRLVENAVDLSDFPQCLSFNEAHKASIKIVTVGGIRPQKGPEEFARIAALSSSLPIEFIWIGDGEISSKELLREAGVRVVGWCSRSEVLAYLQSADLYLSTSRWEGMPISIIEAFATGIPVVARNCAGNHDLIEHTINGHLFDTTEDAITLIHEFLDSPQVFLQGAQCAHQQVFERFSIKRFSNQLEQVYQHS
ncbi:glycosyltransferase [Vibrio cholerae]|uniref:glycosyltransferase n=2 Tax=Vibrio cholerae TaxID=666 RepID=UPI0011D951CF|nr:glycosyltransferase [Vibrio cholerae]TXY59297.1 glycosyltransferase family 4 protein [Vibrio cholerae]BCN16893.1 putative glycosyltransferase [Vibrio cholerae]BCN17281.1 putative glycosyltransferase [Vibrio cholerae]GHX54706.1 capsular biosynthesis protein [Vibrio cholerae]GHZ08852.1 capsular biosynthesis protein [Vibrio cholerae]